MWLKAFGNKVYKSLQFRYGRSVKKKLKNSGLLLDKGEKDLQKLVGLHKGEKAVVIGMGPSLSVADLQKLNGFVTFACNKIYLSFEETSWRPDYYSVCDILVAKNNFKDIIKADFGATRMIHAKLVEPYLADQQNALFYHWDGSMQNWQNHPMALKTNFINGLWGGGYSVLLDQIQMAYIMGFDEVYVIGADFNFKLGKVTEENSASGNVLQSQGEVNHFHKNYRKPGETWTVPRMDEQRNAFAFCENQYSLNGRKLINASRNTKLDVLPIIHFDSVFK